MLRTLLLALIVCAGLFGQPKALFYMQDTPAALRSFQANASKIDIIVPTGTPPTPRASCGVRPTLW